MNKTLRKIIICISFACLLWFLMFSPLTSKQFNFWLLMSISAATLTFFSFLYNGSYLKSLRFSWLSLLYGCLIAISLWGIFWIGDKMSSLLFDFARPQVNIIYAMKDGSNKWLIASLLVVLIGPAEEIFWRGYIQQKLSELKNPNCGFVVTLLTYTLIHIWSLNLMLIMAAFIAGLIWGGLYRLSPKLLPALVLSHALWDAAVFVVFPI